jgi:segregation and condensation protein B
MAGLETLAIIAYRQPITAPEINEVRGVNSSGVLRTLLDRRMIRIAGRKPVVGSPFLYRTTKEFLVHFGLNTIQDLPRLEEFSEMLGVNLPEDLILPDEILIENEVALEGGEAATRARAVEHDEDHVDRARAETSDERISNDEPDVDAPADVVSGDVSRGGLAVEDRAPDADEGAVDAGEEDRKPVEFPSNDQD